MSKTIPQMKRIERGDPERVEQISTPYEWQRKKPEQPKKPEKTERSDRTVPDLRGPKRR